MDNLVSIIVPVYNVEVYLDECLKSIVEQTYTKLEILLIDDGSTDSCPTICDKWGKKDNRIKVIHKKNGGLSDARNVGLDLCKGDYICFIDSDDFVSNDFIMTLYINLVNNNVDISACYFYKYFNEMNKKFEGFSNVEKKYNKLEAHKYMHIIGYYDIGVWNKMYKREMFSDIRFPIGKKSEDIFVMHKVIDRANSLYYSSVPKYFYRQREGSITKSSNINFDVLEATNVDLQYYIDKNYQEVIPFALQYYIFSRIGVYNALLCRTKDKTGMKRIRNEILKHKTKKIYSELSFERKVQLFLFFHFVPLYNCIFKMYKKV